RLRSFPRKKLRPRKLWRQKRQKRRQRERKRLGLRKKRRQKRLRRREPLRTARSKTAGKNGKIWFAYQKAGAVGRQLLWYLGIIFLQELLTGNAGLCHMYRIKYFIQLFS